MPFSAGNRSAPRDTGGLVEIDSPFVQRGQRAWKIHRGDNLGFAGSVHNHEVRIAGNGAEMVASAGNVSEIQCQAPAELVQEALLFQKSRHTSLIGCGPNRSSSRMGSTKAAHVR